MEVVGEACDWESASQLLPGSRSELLLVDWDLLQPPRSLALGELRKQCSTPLAVVLMSHHTAREQAAISSGADAFISTREIAGRVVEQFRAAAASVQVGEPLLEPDHPTHLSSADWQNFGG